MGTHQFRVHFFATPNCSMGCRQLLESGFYWELGLVDERNRAAHHLGIQNFEFQLCVANSGGACGCGDRATELDSRNWAHCENHLKTTGIGDAELRVERHVL